MRVHQSHLINLAHMKEIDHGDNFVLMTDGSKVEISKRKKKEFSWILWRKIILRLHKIILLLCLV
jgi:DNA-binding LytR/AlgR family response regulator